MKSLNLLSRGNLYLRVLIYLMLFYLWVIFTSESLSFIGGSRANLVSSLIFAILWAPVFIYGVELLRTFGYSSRFVLGMRIYVITGLLVGFTFGNPLLDFSDLPFLNFIYIGFHASTAITLVIITFGILSDIFSSQSTKTDHIWGAIVAYFLGIMIFADFYEIMCLFRPGLLGFEFKMGVVNYIECTIFSINAISGLDSLYPNAHPFFQKLANIEHITGNLFLVVILGRLLSHPLSDKAQGNS